MHNRWTFTESLSSYQGVFPFRTIPKDVEPNSVPKLVPAGNFLLLVGIVCFSQNVKMSRSIMMKGVMVFRLSSDSDIFADPSLSCMSDDEFDNWCTGAKLRMKVGVTAYRGSTLDLEMVVSNVVSGHSRDFAPESSFVKDALRSSSDRTRSAVNVAVLLAFGSETSMSLMEASARATCVMLVITLTQ